MTYGIQAWGNSTSITKLGVLQKRVIRIINKNIYRSHTDPIFKSESILKISDLYKLHVSLFMFDLQNYQYHLKHIYNNQKLLPTIQCAPDNMVF